MSNSGNKTVGWAGKPFSSVFQKPRSAGLARWRIRNSGVMGAPELAQETCAILSACSELNIQVEQQFSRAPGYADSYKLAARFLDGGIEGETGNYMGGERGLWVMGPKSVLLLALQIGLKVRPSWNREYGLIGVTLDDLKKQITRPPSKGKRAR